MNEAILAPVVLFLCIATASYVGLIVITNFGHVFWGWLLFLLLGFPSIAVAIRILLSTFPDTATTQGVFAVGVGWFGSCLVFAVCGAFGALLNQDRALGMLYGVAFSVVLFGFLVGSPSELSENAISALGSLVIVFLAWMVADASPPPLSSALPASNLNAKTDNIIADVGAVEPSDAERRIRALEKEVERLKAKDDSRS
jgi:hypothetical protein